MPHHRTAGPRVGHLAISLSVMLEGWAEGSAPGIGPMGNPLKPGVADLQALSWAEYGPKVGAWRLLDLLDREQARAVFYTSGVVAERYPDLPAAIAARGHVVAAHGWSQGTLPAYLTEDAERDDISRCVEVLHRTAGCHPPAGSARAARRARIPRACWHARGSAGTPTCSMPICRTASIRRMDRWSACRSPWR